MQPLLKSFWLILFLTATSHEAAAAQPVPDEPFEQEYRDPFVLGETREANDVRAVAVDSDGRVWAATAAGLRVVEQGRLVEPAGETVDGPAYDVAAAADGTVWIGAWNGLYRTSDGKLERVCGLRCVLDCRPR